MSESTKVVFVDPSEETGDALKSLLMGIDTIRFEADCSRYEFFIEIVKSSAPEIAIINLDSDVDKAMNLIASVRAAMPACNIIAVSKSTDGKNILAAMRAGAKEYVSAPVDRTEMVEAIERLQQVSASESGEQSVKSRVVTVAGCAGGVGSTSIAVNIAAYLATDPDKRVVLIDLDLALGDTDIYLDMIPEYTLLDVVQNAERLDESLIERTLTKHSSGLFLLPRPVQLQEMEEITPDDLDTTLEMMKSFYTHIIIDVSKSYTPLDQVALEAATDVLMITQLDLPCLRNVVRLMMSFEETNGLREKTHVVMNRTGLKTGQISTAKAETFIGTEVFAQIPNEYKVMTDVRNNGVPLVTEAPKAGITSAICKLADRVCGITIEEGEAAAPSGKRSLFSFGSRGK